MKPILVLYATREGQTRKVADRVANAFQSHGLTATVVDAAELPEPFDLSSYGAAVLAASVHGGKHEREMVRFVKKHRAELERIPTTFLSTSLSEAGAEDAHRTAEARAKASADVQHMLDQFFVETGWHPTSVKPIAGALMYTHYGALIRFIMKQISKKEGGSTDTAHDHEYTDWSALDRFVEQLVQNDFRPDPHGAAAG